MNFDKSLEGYLEKFFESTNDEIFEFADGNVYLSGTRNELLEIAYALIQNCSDKFVELGYRIFDSFGVEDIMPIEDLLEMAENAMDYSEEF